MKKFIFYGMVTLALAFAMSCTPTDDFHQLRHETVIAEITAELPEGDLSYKTTQPVNVSVSFKNHSGEPLQRAYVEIFTQSPYNEEGLKSDLKPLFKGMTDSNGKLSTLLTVQTYVKELFICPSHVGIANEYKIPITSPRNVLKITHEPHNYSASQAVTAGIKTGNLNTLGAWDAQGVPNYLFGQDEITSEFLSLVTAALPENHNLALTRPELFSPTACTNIILQDEGEVYITFLHEGAGFKNTFGFYTYEVGNAPQTAEDIDNLTIIFPNASYAGSGGGLYSGDKVLLGTFPENTVIAWFVAAQGWTTSPVGTGAYKVYSDSYLNPENTPDLQQHAVMLHDQNTNRYIIGFEDLKRSYSGCDNDFNDVVFYATVTPEDAVLDDDIIDIQDPIDSDGDGVTDDNDDYPNDPELAFDNYSVNSTLAYEDLWPSEGDYDFNDLVLSYQFNQITNAQNLVAKIDAKMSIRAIGAGFHNGFALQMPIAPTLIASVSGAEFSPDNYFNIAGNGTELNQNQTVIPIFDDAQYFFDNRGMVNVHRNSTFVQPDTFNLSIELLQPVSLNDLGNVPYNPFIVKNGDRRIEIHLSGMMPSALMNTALFGSSDDDSNLESGRSYITQEGKPWAINIAGEFYHPYESVRIEEGYLKFQEWANSGGTLYQDWYLDLPGYRNMSQLYPQP